jgi:hypothetical protein
MDRQAIDEIQSLAQRRDAHFWRAATLKLNMLYRTLPKDVQRSRATILEVDFNGLPGQIVALRQDVDLR